MKITFNDSETKQILSTLCTVNANRVNRCRTTKGAIKSQKKTVNEFAKRIDSWVKIKIQYNYESEIKKRLNK